MSKITPIFYPSYILKNGSELGWIVDEDSNPWIALHSQAEDPELGLFIPESRLEVMEARRSISNPDDPPDQFIAAKWDPQVQERIKELIDALITLCFKAPHLNQLHLFGFDEINNHG